MASFRKHGGAGATDLRFAARGFGFVCLVVAGCLASLERSPAGEAKTTAQGPAAAPADTLTAALADFNRGAGLMEQYRYGQAAEAFERVVQSFPDWTAARFNLGLASLLQFSPEAYAKARGAFEQILQVEPNHLHARFCLGMYYVDLEQNEKALECFEKVHQADPADPHAAYRYGERLRALGRNDEAIRVFEKVVASDPGFISAIYGLGWLHHRLGHRDEAAAVFRRFKELNLDELIMGSYVVRSRYDMSGKYFRVIGIEGVRLPQAPREPSPRILFSPEVGNFGLRLQPWKWAGGTVNLPGIAVGDLNEDGHLDLVLTGSGDEGRATVWFNDGHGKFSPGPAIADHAVSPCLGDVDNDGHLDIWLGRVGADLLLLGDGQGHFRQAPSEFAAGDGQLTACARLLDLDSDGDLDLLSLRWAAGTVPLRGETKPAACRLFNNNRDGKFPEVAAGADLAFADTPLAGIIADDFDGDRDRDLIVLPAQGPPIAWVNDRVGKHHTLPAQTTGLYVPGAISATTGDGNKHGRRDLLLSTGKEVHLFVNRGGLRFEEDADFAAAFGKLGGTGGQFVDIDNDGDLDLVIPDAHRRDGTRGPVLLLNDWPNRRFLDAQLVDPGNLLGAIRTQGDASCVVADFTGDGRCDILLVAMNEQPQLIENVTRGGHFIGLDLVGTRGDVHGSRSNGSAIGARAEINSGLVSQQYVVGVPSGPAAMPPLRIHAGLGANPNVQWLRIVWPDARLQAELELAADQVLRIKEEIRLVSSCPHVYAWDGDRFVLVSDFGGVGGLGYWLAPETYPKPDPTEYVPIPRLEPRDGQYVLQILGSLEETIYLDEIKLIAVDHPAGTQICPREMMAIGLAPPPFEVFCFREPVEPVRAVDQDGRDVTEQLRRIDRSYAGATELDERFEGYAKDHFVDLDFGDQLRNLWPGARLILTLYGSTEYPYSSTNYAAFQAGLRFQATSLYVWRNQAWVELLHEAGCPGGMQHVMALDVTDLLRPDDRRIRLASNMEIYWDRIFLAAHLRDTPLRLAEVPVRSADLHFRGYARPYSPDGRRPELFDYERVERATPWKLMAGDYTRYGEVAGLLQEADDCFVIMSRGDEITLRFPTDAFGPVPPGCQRSFLLKTDSYTKDMDLYTALGDTVEPLPFHAMSGYPYGPDERYPESEKTITYRREFNTRRIQAH